LFFLFFFVSSNLIFFSQHYLGMLNFPRRIFDYSCIYFLFNYLGFVGIFGTLLSITVFFNIFGVLIRFSIIHFNMELVNLLTNTI
jgi:cytochrome c oxidase subunit 1